MRFSDSTKTTRKGDLEHLEQMRHLNPKTFTRQLDNIWHQSQDGETERLRRLLVEAHKRHDLQRVDEIERYMYTLQKKR